MILITLPDNVETKFNFLNETVRASVAELSTRSPLQKQLRELMNVIKQHKKAESIPLEELIEILEAVNNVFTAVSKQSNAEFKEKIAELMVLANSVEGRPSPKLKKIGAMLMGVGILFMVSAVLIITLGAVGIVPSFGASIFMSLFGMAPFMTGLGFFKKGHRLFKSGQRQGISKKIQGVTRLANLSLFAGSRSASVDQPLQAEWIGGLAL